MYETRTVEFKESITNTFLKTVSAFSNYDGGVIYFGIDDNGNIKGLSDVKQSCLDIENKINDSISPQPDYKLDIQSDNTIKLIVQSGIQKPYLYKSKAYKRNDTATIEVDTLELSRLILEGKNIKFEELPCSDQVLTFGILRQKLKEYIQIETFNQDTLKTLNLYNEAMDIIMQRDCLPTKIIFLESILLSSAKISALFRREQPLKIYQFWMYMIRR